MHGSLQPHPVDQFHKLLRPGWINAAWLAGAGALAGLGWSIGVHVGAWITHWMR